MLVRHDFVTPFVDGIRFFDKPPLLYWLAAASMHLFGVHAWAARLPLALITLALLLATYALGLRLFSAVSPAHAPDRAALYSTLALGTCIGPYLYTRFYIPDIALTLWTTLAIDLFLCALDRVPGRVPGYVPDRLPDRLPTNRTSTQRPGSTLAPMLGFAAVLALSALTKGLVGLVFPVGFALLFLLLTRRLSDLRRLHVPASLALFFVLAAPWHILAALRNPAIPMPPGLGLPVRAGWAWFYLYNEHVARFFSRRIPHDYGQVPIPLFWLLGAVWLIPWAAFLPAALLAQVRHLRSPAPAGSHLRSTPIPALLASATEPSQRETALTLLVWAALVFGFFTLSARQEYYSLPALPALTLMIGALLARADTPITRPSLTTATPHVSHHRGQPDPSPEHSTPCSTRARQSTLRASALFLLPFGSIAALVALGFAVTAPRPAPHTDISTLLAAKGGSYNLSLSHVFDLTGTAMGLFRGPLIVFALSMLGIGPGSWLLRRAGHTLAANLTLAAAATLLLLSMHGGLVRFYPVLGTEQLAEDILAHQRAQPRPNDLIVIDGELTAGSTLLFYTRQSVSLLNGRVNGPWFGSLWPDAPAVFEDTASLHAQWSSPRRVFLLTYHPAARAPELQAFGPVLTLSSAGGKALLSNRP